MLIGVVVAVGLLAGSTAQPSAGGPAVAAVGDRNARSEAGVVVERGLRYGGPAQAVLDVYRRRSPGVAEVGPAVLVVHGGGWRFGDKRRMGAISRALATHGFVTFNVDYTLARWGRPGFPAQPVELRTAVRWVRRNAARFGVDPTRIGALGSSAGAHLAALAALGGHGSSSAGARVRAVVAWSGPFDLRPLDRHPLTSAVEEFLGCAVAACPRRAATASPVAHVSADDPPMLIVSSEDELVPVEQATAMASQLASVGVPQALWVLPGRLHGTEYTAIALGRSIEFLRHWLR